MFIYILLHVYLHSHTAPPPPWILPCLVPTKLYLQYNYWSMQGYLPAVCLLGVPVLLSSVWSAGERWPAAGGVPSARWVWFDQQEKADRLLEEFPQLVESSLPAVHSTVGWADFFVLKVNQLHEIRFCYTTVNISTIFVVHIHGGRIAYLRDLY